MIKTVRGRYHQGKINLDEPLDLQDGSEVVVQDAQAYQAMVERLRAMEDLVAIREGLAQADAGHTRPAREVFGELKKKHGL